MIGLLTAIAIPNLRRSMVRAELIGNVKVVRQAVAVSRIHAIKNSRRVALKILNDATIEAGPVVVAWVDDDLDEVFDAGEDEVGSWRIDSTIFLGPDVTDANRSLHVLSGTERGVVFLPTGTAITHGDSIGVGQGAVVISDYKLNQVRLTIQAGAGTVIEEMWDPSETDWSIHERFWRY
jgi:Tfp pilus assembly protein FimT